MRLGAEWAWLENPNWVNQQNIVNSRPRRIIYSVLLAEAGPFGTCGSAVILLAFGAGGSSSKAPPVIGVSGSGGNEPCKMAAPARQHVQLKEDLRLGDSLAWQRNPGLLLALSFTGSKPETDMLVKEQG
eukprot:g39319.t1